MRASRNYARNEWNLGRMIDGTNNSLTFYQWRLRCFPYQLSGPASSLEMYLEPRCFLKNQAYFRASSLESEDQFLHDDECFDELVFTAQVLINFEVQQFTCTTIVPR